MAAFDTVAVRAECERGARPAKADCGNYHGPAHNGGVAVGFLCERRIGHPGDHAWSRDVNELVRWPNAAAAGRFPAMTFREAMAALAASREFEGIGEWRDTPVRKVIAGR